MKIESLKDVFERGLEFAYNCEQQLIKALPKMAQASTSSDLRNAFEQHLEETRNHADRLEQIFSMLGRDADARSNDIVKEMVNEGDTMIKHIDASSVRDAALIVAGNQVEHYEMAVYGSLRNFAQLLGYDEAVRLLEQTLQEEKAADSKLTDIGETTVNQQALEPVHA